LFKTRIVQNVRGAAPLGGDAQKCAALTELSPKTVPGGPAVITSTQLIEVPASGLEPPLFHPSGYTSSAAAKVASKSKHYCHVTGYVAPQNKFELKLPWPAIGIRNFSFMRVVASVGTSSGKPAILVWVMPLIGKSSAE
jgi:hypothetical protein